MDNHIDDALPGDVPLSMKEPGCNKLACSNLRDQRGDEEGCTNTKLDIEQRQGDEGGCTNTKSLP